MSQLRAVTWNAVLATPGLVRLAAPSPARAGASATAWRPSQHSRSAAVRLFVDTHVLSLLVGIAAALSALLLGPSGIDAEAGVVIGYGRGDS